MCYDAAPLLLQRARAGLVRARVLQYPAAYRFFSFCLCHLLQMRSAFIQHASFWLLDFAVLEGLVHTPFLGCQPMHARGHALLRMQHALPDVPLRLAVR